MDRDEFPETPVQQSMLDLSATFIQFCEVNALHYMQFLFVWLLAFCNSSIATVSEPVLRANAVLLR